MKIKCSIKGCNGYIALKEGEHVCVRCGTKYFIKVESK